MFMSKNSILLIKFFPFRLIAFIIADDSHPPFINPALDTIVPLLEEGGRKFKCCAQGIENFDYSRTNNFLSEPYDLLYILVGSFQTGIGNIAQLSYLRNPDASIMLTLGQSF